MGIICCVSHCCHFCVTQFKGTGRLKGPCILSSIEATHPCCTQDIAARAHSQPAQGNHRQHAACGLPNSSASTGKQQQPYRLNGLLMHLMDSASAVSNGTSEEGKFPFHGDSEEKMNWQCKGSSLQHWMLCRRAQGPDPESSSLLEHPWALQGQNWAVSEPQQLAEAKGSRKLWPPWSGPLNSTPQSWWRGGTETGAGNCSHGHREAVPLDRVLQLSGGRQSLKFLCWIHIGSSVTFLLVTYPWLSYFCIIFELQLLINKLVYRAESKSPFSAELLLCHSFVRQLSSFF